MSNRKSGDRKLVFGIIVLFIGLAIAPGITTTVAEIEKSNSSSRTITFFQEFSSPLVEEDEEYVRINVREADFCITNPGEPKIPVFTKIFEFSWGTEITNVECVLSDVRTMSVSKRIEPVSSQRWIDDDCDFIFEKKANQVIYSSSNPYPEDWFSYKKGAGLNKNGEHVLFLSLCVYPVRYMPVENVVEYIDSTQVTITYEEGFIGFESNIYDLVVITPAEYSDNLWSLVEHKNSHDVKTNLTTVESIYELFPGRDKAEQIKYFIKYALEEWGISYVLLVGDIKRLPIRDTDAYPWDGWGDNILTDLYYADIYDENFCFCSWDANHNSTFGEVEYSGFPPQGIDLDGVDLYPDVRVGRLACRNLKEVNIVVDKIIRYEENTYGRRWFKKIILAGGDTFPPCKGSPPFIYEGEITNKKVAEQLPDFRHIKLWTSRRTLNALTFNMAINRGAGFLSYAGHGFDNAWYTYPPNAAKNREISYDMLYLHALRNHYKLPIVFFDACLTARLDFNMRMFNGRYPKMVSLFETLTGITYDPSDIASCFAWKFITMKNGGAIATIGATRPAYTWVDKKGVYAGAGYLDVAFFKAYEEGVTVGEMLKQAQNDYINNVGKDYFTIEVFILLGDPSLMVGGYS